MPNKMPRTSATPERILVSTQPGQCAEFLAITPASLRIALTSLLLLTGAGCSQQPVSSEQSCEQLFATRDQLTQGTRDGQFAQIRGFYGLRSSRLDALLASEAISPEQQRLWLQRLAANDIAASAIEQRNLPASARNGLDNPAFQAQLNACRSNQIRQLLSDSSALDQLRNASAVADDYSHWARALGLYPLLKPLYRKGIAQWQAEAATTTEPQDSARWLNYQPVATDTSALPAKFTFDALGLPQVDAEQLQALFVRHAPLINVEQASPADRIGQPRFNAQGERQFSPLPVIYQHTGWSRIDGRWHLQLIYQMWFRERPKSNPLDMLGGDLDGLIWRVTLDDQGAALLYDSIHPCGCWHSFFVPESSALRFSQAQDEENRPHRLVAVDASKPATLWLSAREHALVWVDQRTSASVPITYQQASLDQLRQLDHGQGTKSLYQPDGLISGTERLERWVLWPSGVHAPGSMRQWGRHATAFIGRAHFDDPLLLERYFNAAP